MTGKEKLIKVIRDLIEKQKGSEIEIAEMINETDIKLKGLEIKKPLLFYLETATVDINTKLNLVGQVAAGGGGESPHSHGWSFTDTSTYIYKLKAGDKVAVYKLNKGRFLVLGKVIEK